MFPGECDLFSSPLLMALKIARFSGQSHGQAEPVPLWAKGDGACGAAGLCQGAGSPAGAPAGRVPRCVGEQRPSGVGVPSAQRRRSGSFAYGFNPSNGRACPRRRRQPEPPCIGEPTASLGTSSQRRIVCLVENLPLLSSRNLLWHFLLPLPASLPDLGSMFKKWNIPIMHFCTKYSCFPG